MQRYAGEVKGEGYMQRYAGEVKGEGYMQRYAGEVKGLCYLVFCLSGLPSVVVLVLHSHCFSVGMDGVEGM